MIVMMMVVIIIIMNADNEMTQRISPFPEYLCAVIAGTEVLATELEKLGREPRAGRVTRRKSVRLAR